MALQVKFADLSSSLSLGADMRSHSRPHHPRVKPPLARFQRHRYQEKRNHSLPISSTHLTSLQASPSPSFLTYRGKALEKSYRRCVASPLLPSFLSSTPHTSSSFHIIFSTPSPKTIPRSRVSCATTAKTKVTTTPPQQPSAKKL